MGRPQFKLSVKLKDGDGRRDYPIAFWKSDRGDSWNGKLDDGWKLVGPDGTEYTSGRDGSAYLDLYKQDQRGGGRSSSQRSGAGKPPSFGDDDFQDDFGDDKIPF